MKALLLLLVLTSCTLNAPTYYDYMKPTQWVHDNIEYSYVNQEEWQLPHETIERGAGDCEDFALLLLYVVKDMYGVEGFLVVFEGETAYHAVAQFDAYYDAVSGCRFSEIEGRVAKIWTYQEAMWTAMFH